MKNFKKIGLIMFAMVSLMLLSSCSGTKTVVYEMEKEGTTITMTMEYDKDENVQKNITDMKMNFEDLPISEEQIKAIADEGGEEYKDIKGVEYKSNIKDSELTMTLTYTLKDMTEEDIENNFGSVTDDKGNVKIDKMVSAIEAQEGMEKK